MAHVRQKRALFADRFFRLDFFFQQFPMRLVLQITDTDQIQRDQSRAYAENARKHRQVLAGLQLLARGHARLREQTVSLRPHVIDDLLDLFHQVLAFARIDGRGGISHPLFLPNLDRVLHLRHLQVAQSAKFEQVVFQDAVPHREVRHAAEIGRQGGIGFFELLEVGFVSCQQVTALAAFSGLQVRVKLAQIIAEPRCFLRTPQAFRQMVPYHQS